MHQRRLDAFRVTRDELVRRLQALFGHRNAT